MDVPLELVFYHSATSASVHHFCDYFAYLDSLLLCIRVLRVLVTVTRPDGPGGGAFRANIARFSRNKEQRWNNFES